MNVDLCYDAPKPYLHPVVAPDGRHLSTVSPADHVWHRGLWFAIKYIDDDNFWEEVPPFGRQIRGDDGSLEWIRPDGTIALVEQREVIKSVASDGTTAIDWAARLVATSPVVLERTPFTTWGGYGGLAFRGAAEWVDTRLLVDGRPEPLRRPEGVRGRWCDLSSDEAGLTFFDHPDNPRHPVPWYGATRSRVYGEGWSNFLNAALLFDAPMTLSEGELLILRYRILVHGADWSADRCEAAWRAWAES